MTFQPTPPDNPAAAVGFTVLAVLFLIALGVVFWTLGLVGC